MPVSPVVEARVKVAKLPVVVETKSEPIDEDAAESAVVEAFTAVKLEMNPEVKVSPVPERLVVDAVPIHELVE